MKQKTCGYKPCRAPHPYPFTPGVIQGMQRRRRRSRAERWEFILVRVIFVASGVIAVISMLALLGIWEAL